MFGRGQPKTREGVERRVAELGWWYHHFELPNGVWTGDGQPPAYDPSERWALIAPHLPDDLRGKSVLDVGGNSGFFSVQMKLRGAGKCVMVEPIASFVEQAKFVFLQFGVRVKIVNDDVHTYCLTTRERFDYVVFLGLFYHLKYPGLVLDRLAEMTKTLMLFQSHIQGRPTESGDAVVPADLDREDLATETMPRMSFIEEAYLGDVSNWWIPNYQALEPLARSAGLRVVARPHPETLVAEPERYLGTVRRRRLVFPRYGTRDGPVLP